MAASKYEDLLAEQLAAEGIEFEREYKFHPHRKWRADFYLPFYRLCIEVEGITYRGVGGRHQQGAGAQADMVKYNEMAVMGYHLLRFSPALVTGKAKSNLKAVDREEQAIDTITRWIASKQP